MYIGATKCVSNLKTGLVNHSIEVVTAKVSGCKSQRNKPIFTGNSQWHLSTVIDHKMIKIKLNLRWYALFINISILVAL